MARLTSSCRRLSPLAAGIAVGIAISAWVTVHAAAVLPTLSLTAPSDGDTVRGIVSLSAIADGPGLAGLQFQVSGQNAGAEITSGSCSTSWDTRSLADGSRTIVAVGRDSVGDNVWSAPVVVNVQNGPPPDTTAPTVSLTAPTANATVSGSVAVQATAGDDVGVSGVWFTLDGANLGSEIPAPPFRTMWTTNGVGNGSHALRAFARDAAGNTANSVAMTVTVSNVAPDTTAPSVSVSAPANGATVGNTVTVSAAASDNVGVTSVQFTLDGASLGSPDTAAPYATPWNTSGAANGSHVLRAVARDAAGNTATAAAVTVTVSNLAPDTTAPSVSVSAPANGATVGNTVTVSAAASDNVGVTSVQFTLDGASLGSPDTAAPYATPWNTSGAANGSHVLRAVARDAAGNTATAAAVTVTVSNVSTDTTSPSVSLTSPSMFATVSGTITVAASASDNVGVAGVQFTLDGSDLGAEDASPGYAVPWNTVSTSNGFHTLRAVARDAAGNRQTSSPRWIIVSNSSLQDTTAPTVSISTPADGATVSGDVSVTAAAADDIGVAGVQFLVDNTTVGDEDTTAPYQVAWRSAGVANGPHQLTAVARDGAGNRRTSAAVTVTVDNRKAAAAAGDLNGDGTPDLLFEHSSGRLYSWLMQDTSLSAEGPLTPGAVSPDWHVVSIDDFNGDGQNDLLWQNSASGRLYIWLMRDLNLIGTLQPPSAAMPWQVSTTGDMNGDGKADIVWQQPETGDRFVWYMDGASLMGTERISNGAVDPSWNIVGAADFNHDGHTDLLWQNYATGALQVWYLDGVSVLQVVPLTPGSVVPSWRIKAVADFNHDGDADIVWQSTSGALYIWYMNGTVLVNGSFLERAQVDPAWQVVGSR